MAEKTISVSQQQTKPIKILKWKVGLGNTVAIGRVILLYDFEGATKTQQRKLKVTQAGTVYKIVAQAGAIVNPGELLCELKECTHPTVMNDMCGECGTDLRKNDVAITASVPMVHAIPDLKVSEELAQKLGKADVDRLIKDRKLVLLVDLDQTLIHTTNDNIQPNIKDVYHFQLYGPNSPWYFTRLRPGTHDFLNNIYPFFELHICTFGARNYAHMIAGFLDRDQRFFSNRILSRDECFDPTSKKANLKALFPCGDNLVCIIDDREDVWSNASNLIHVKPYHFFQHTGDINAPPGLDKHENDNKLGVDLTKIKIVQKQDDISDKKCNNEEEQNTEVANSENQEISENSNDLKTNHTTELKSTNEQNAFEKKESVQKAKSEKIVEMNGNAKMGEEADNGKIQESNGNEVTSDSKLPATDKIENGKIEDSKAGDINVEDNKIDDTKTEEEPKTENSKTEDTILDNEKAGDTKIESCEEHKVNAKPEDRKAQIENDEEKNKLNEESKESKDDLEHVIEKENCASNPIEEQKTNASIPQEMQMIEVEDADDYLLYLEDVLKRIHKAFYEDFDCMESGDVPDLKKVIPRVRGCVLQGFKLVFSGLVPTHIKLEQSKAYQIAKSLGAVVTQELEDDSTHLVAVRPGTAKVNAGRRKKNLQIVTPDWLWCCAERWEHVNEKMFALNSKGSKNRHPPPHCSSPEHAVSYPEHKTPAMRKRTPSGRFMDTINPLMSFSSADIADMDKEVEDILDDESDSSEDDTTKPIVPTPSKTEQSTSSSSSEDSLTAECPKGYKRKRDDVNINTDVDNNTEDDESPSIKFRRGELVDSELDLEPDSQDTDGSMEAPDEVDDGEWNMMGAALEREFLSNN